MNQNFRTLWHTEVKFSFLRLAERLSDWVANFQSLTEVWGWFFHGFKTFPPMSSNFCKCKISWGTHALPKVLTTSYNSIDYTITAKRILARHGIQTSSFVKIWLVCSPEFKTNFLFFGIHMAWFFHLESLGVRYIMIWWLAYTSILAGNLNSGCKYLVTGLYILGNMI